MYFESVKFLFNSSTSGLSLSLNNAIAELILSTQPDAFAPKVKIFAGVQPLRPSPKTATFLAPYSYKVCD